jgi:hypothetical protein
MRRQLAIAASAALLLGAPAARSVTPDDLAAVRDLPELRFDLCTVAPLVCDPNAPVLEPADPPEPPAPSGAALEGTARVKGPGFAAAQGYALLIQLGEATFLAADGSGATYGGRLVPKGRKGDKLQLFLDEGSADAFAAQVGARGAAAAGRSPGRVLGDSSKLLLQRGPDGALSLKIKSEVLVSGVGTVTFKASLGGVLEGPE